MDGAISVAINLDDKQASRELEKLNAKIAKLKKELNDAGVQKPILEQQLRELGGQLDRAKAKLAEMKNAGKGAFSSSEITEQKEEVSRLQKLFNSCASDLEKVETTLKNGPENLRSMEAAAGDLAKQLAASNGIAPKIAKQFASAKKSIEQFITRVGRLVTSALIFSTITKAFTALRNWIGDIVMATPEAVNAIGRLKGALLTMVQPVVEVIIPAFIRLVNVLTAVVSAIARFTSMLTGRTASQSAATAEQLYGEAKAISATGSAAKKASKQLAGFDEMNVLQDNSDSGGSGGSSSGISPIFDILDSDGLSDGFERILELAKLIGSAILAWKIGTSLGLGIKNIIGLFLVLYGTVQFIAAYIDAWQNGINFDNLNKMLLGLISTVTGLYILLGPVAAAIGSVVAGISLFILGARDAAKNGSNWANVLTMIAGILATGLGLSALVGGPIAMFIAAILSAILVCTQWCGTTNQLIGNMRQIFCGFVDFIAGVFTGDWRRAWEGVKNIFKGIFNTILTIAGSVFNSIIRGINWVISKVNTIRINIPDWVPAIGGSSWSPNLSQVSEWRIPQLAQGGVIPPNREFLAMLGDNKRENEIVSPMSTMKQAFMEALRESGSGSGQTIKVYLDGKQIAQNQYKYLRDMERSRG